MAGNLYLNVGSPYIGTKANQPPNWTFHDRPPTDYDVANFALGDLWLDKSPTRLSPPQDPEPWVLVSKEGDDTSRGELATWVRWSGGTAGSLVSLTGNSGGAVFGDVNQNVNVVGDGTTIDIVGNPGTNTLTASIVGGAAVTNFPTDITGTQNPVLPSGAGAVTVTSSDGSIDVTGNTNEIDIVNHGGQAVTNYPVPNGTTPVVPSAAGAVTLTSNDSSVTITGGLNTIDFVVAGAGDLYTVQTTDATPTTLASIAVTADSAMTLFIELTAADSVYGQSMHANGTGGGVYPTAGALSVTGTSMINITTDFATATFDIVASGNNLVVQVTGEAATTINWVARIRTVTV